MSLHILIHGIIYLLIVSASGSSSTNNQHMVMSDCPSTCGNVSIHYPFGIGKGCYYDEWFAVTCSNITKKPFLSKFNMEVIEVNIDLLADFYFNKITVMIPVASNCGQQQRRADNNNTIWSSTNFTGSPYSYDSSLNKFVVAGCDSATLLIDPNHDTEMKKIGCVSTCEPDTIAKGCYGVNCCEDSFPDYPVKKVSSYNISIEEPDGSTGCTNAFLSKISPPRDLSLMTNNVKEAPVVVKWGLRNVFGRSPVSTCLHENDTGYICMCKWEYEGNPYLPDGCKRVIASRCVYIESLDRIHFCHTWIGILIGCLIGLILHLLKGQVLLLLCGFCFMLYKLIKKRRIANLKRKFFKRNGGLLLQQHISSDEGTANRTIVFTSNELLKATDNYNENRILGQGGQGTVYKGMLTDGRITAVKKSKLIDESQLEQFINEVVILSQMNHRSIVKLLGCCLETEVPLLVYEFVVNGNLYDLIHNKVEEFPFSWKMRLQIATEVAGGLAYLHSASSIPIYHRDIKSTNILLDEKFGAKISDFGASRTIAIEQTHLTTLVYGTLGYVDPEYYQSSQFTDKSDVYSFGVVLAELLTGQKPISSLHELQEERSLATRFTLCAEQMRVFDIVDLQIIKEAPKEEILAVSDIARRCLNVNGKKRPTMNEVMLELEVVSRPSSNLDTVSVKQYTFDIEKNKNRIIDHEDYSTSTLPNNRASSSSDAQLLHAKKTVENIFDGSYSMENNVFHVNVLVQEKFSKKNVLYVLSNLFSSIYLFSI